MAIVCSVALVGPLAAQEGDCWACTHCSVDRINVAPGASPWMVLPVQTEECEINEGGCENLIECENEEEDLQAALDALESRDWPLLRRLMAENPDMLDFNRARNILVGSSCSVLVALQELEPDQREFFLSLP